MFLSPHWALGWHFRLDLVRELEESLRLTRRRRLQRDTTPLQRGIVRNVVLVLDCSDAMTEKDLRPTRYLLTIRYAQEFVTEFFEQNPISQLGVIAMRDGIAVTITEQSGNPNDHIVALEKLRTEDPKGYPSLQNALEFCRGRLSHAPAHGTREVLIIYGALISADPGDIHITINSLVAERIRVSIVGLAAQVAICREMCVKTNSGDDRSYGVSLNEQHFKDLFLSSTTPPVTHSVTESAASLLQMGFPSRLDENKASLCACHSRLTKGGYLCTRCETKVCNLPIDCPACGLTLILSTHLARSYHHLFPLKNWVEVPWKDAHSVKCFSCVQPFPPVPTEHRKAETEAAKAKEKAAPPSTAPTKNMGTSESSRYMCETCGNHFCVDCDIFCHEQLHNCPGCQSTVFGDEQPEYNGANEDTGNGHMANGDGDAMDTGA